jgi:molybdate transport system substrate-binding protein
VAVASTLGVGFLFSPVTWTGEAVVIATELTVLSADVFTGVLGELTGDFERSTGHKVTILYGTAGAIRSRVQTGESGDLTILPRPVMDALLQQGRITPGSIVDVARSAVGVAVRRGAPRPDISSGESFARSLAAAQSISYPDPERGGATGVLFTHVLERLGMTDAVRSKTRFPPVGQFAVDVVARGEAEIAISQPMEVFAQPGVELVGLLPPELQDLPNFVFAAGVLESAKQPLAAGALIASLSGPAAASVWKAKGMEPASSR